MSSILAEPSTPPQPRVLVIEQAVGELLELVAGLRDSGMVVEQIAPPADVMALSERFRPSVALLSIHEGDPQGFALIEQLGLRGCGVIVFAGTDEELRVASLDHGADDVLAGPVPLRELAARIRAVHRRVARPQRVAPDDGELVTLDVAHRCLLGPTGNRTPLSEAEFVTLETLLDANGAPVSREWLGRVALKRPHHPDDRSVDQLVLKLRRKLTAAGAPERTILSARRQGYIIPDPSRFRIAASYLGRDRTNDPESSLPDHS